MGSSRALAGECTHCCIITGRRCRHYCPQINWVVPRRHQMGLWRCVYRNNLICCFYCMRFKVLQTSYFLLSKTFVLRFTRVIIGSSIEMHGHLKKKVIQGGSGVNKSFNWSDMGGEGGGAFSLPRRILMNWRDQPKFFISEGRRVKGERHEVYRMLHYWHHNQQHPHRSALSVQRKCLVSNTVPLRLPEMALHYQRFYSNFFLPFYSSLWFSRWGGRGGE